jgi:hypothetical protein
MESRRNDNTFAKEFDPVISEEGRILHWNSPLISQSHRG